MEPEPIRVQLWNLFNIHRQPCSGEALAEAMTMIARIERCMGLVPLNDRVTVNLIKLAGIRVNQYGKVDGNTSGAAGPNFNMGGKLYLIKLVREHTQLGLKEAKDIVESGELQTSCVSPTIMDFLRNNNLLT